MGKLTINHTTNRFKNFDHYILIKVTSLRKHYKVISWIHCQQWSRLLAQMINILVSLRDCVSMQELLTHERKTVFGRSVMHGFIPNYW